MKRNSFFLNFVIVNYKTYEDTIECVNSILEQKFPKFIDFRIVIIDNNSKNNSLENISSFFKSIEQNYISTSNDKLKSGINLIQNYKNTGFGAANNFVINYINSGYIFLVNPDVLLDNNFIGSIDFSSLDEGFIYGFPTYQFKNKTKLIFYGGYYLDTCTGRLMPALNEKDKLTYINGSGMLTHYSNFKEYKFDENYFLYWEETDLCFRFGHKRLKVLQKSKLFDKISGSIGKGFLSQYYFQRNKLFFLKKHFPQFMPLYIFIFIFSFFFKIISLNFDKLFPTFEAFYHFLINKKGIYK